MGTDITQLKSVLRSLVVSCPTQMDVRTLCRDYRSMMGESIPISKYGYFNMVCFLKEQCGDCFLFHGVPTNPVLTLIVPDRLKHIDKFVKKQKMPSTAKFKSKRMSVDETSLRRSSPQITNYSKPINRPENPSVPAHKEPTLVPVNKIPSPVVTNKISSPVVTNKIPSPVVTKNNSTPVVPNKISSPVVTNKIPSPVVTKNNSTPVVTNKILSPVVTNKIPSLITNKIPAPVVTAKLPNNVTKRLSQLSLCSKDASSTPIQNKINVQECHNGQHKYENGDYHDVMVSGDSKFAVQKFLRQLQPHVKSAEYQNFEHTMERASPPRDDDDSGRLTASSDLSPSRKRGMLSGSMLKHRRGRLSGAGGSVRRRALQELALRQTAELVAAHPAGVYCTALLQLYRERYSSELPFERLGFTSVVSFLGLLDDVLRIYRPDPVGDWLVVTAETNGASQAPSVTPRAARPLRRDLFCTSGTIDPEDALPGIDFEPDVFPPDCLHYVESVPPAPLPDAVRSGGGAGAELHVSVGEVYSPSHFWLLVLGDHHAEMHRIMDQMTEYYTRGEGAGRALSMGAMRVGYYCAALFEGEWHRAVIVRVLDVDTVKVRYIDYGTVMTIPLSHTRPLLREFASLPATPLRARLAGVRPPGAAGGPGAVEARARWSHSASREFLALIQDKELVAHVTAVDYDEKILEVFLIDTSTEEDTCINEELIRSGFAERRPHFALQTSELYLYPTFTALESGETPTLQEIGEYLLRGISLHYVEEYRRHVPADFSLSTPEGTSSDTDCETSPDELVGNSEPQEASLPTEPVQPSQPPPPPPPVLVRTVDDIAPPPGFSALPRNAGAPWLPPPPPTSTSTPISAHAHIPAPPKDESPTLVARIDCEVFLALGAAASETAAQHMQHALSRARSAPLASPGDAMVRLQPMDCEVFRALLKVDVGMAVKHMTSVLQRTMSLPPSQPPQAPTRLTLNPEARVFLPPPPHESRVFLPPPMFVPHPPPGVVVSSFFVPAARPPPHFITKRHF